MANKAVKLLGLWRSPLVMRPMIALNIKSVDYELIEETLAPKSELLLKSNPVHKKVPVLIHGDQPICESLIIMEYIDEVWSSGPSILPSDPYDRATAKFWAAYTDEKWFPSLKGIAAAPGEEAKKAAIERVCDGLVLLEDAYGNCSKGKPFFGGVKMGYLDIAFGCYLGWLRVAERLLGVKLLDEAMTPGLVKWAESFCADPVLNNAMPDIDKLEEFAKMLFANMKGGAPSSLVDNLSQ